MDENIQKLAAEAWQEWESEAYTLGAGFLDYLNGCYPVADDLPDGYHNGAKLAALVVSIVKAEEVTPQQIKALAEVIRDA